MKMTLMQHFSELRRRLLWVLITFVVFFCVGWAVSSWVEQFLFNPLISIWGEETTLVYNNLADGLMIKFSLSTLVALFFSVPILLWNIWAYVSPGLYKNEKKIVLPILILSPILFILGAMFAFYILFPFVFKFLIELTDQSFLPVLLLPTITNYVGFSIGLLKVFGLTFQLPLILILLNKIGLISRDSLIKVRRYIIVGIFVLSAILTPPDIVSQVLLAVPMLMLFEISILFMKK